MTVYYMDEVLATYYIKPYALNLYGAVLIQNV